MLSREVFDCEVVLEVDLFSPSYLMFTFSMPSSETYIPSSLIGKGNSGSWGKHKLFPSSGLADSSTLKHVPRDFACDKKTSKKY